MIKGCGGTINGINVPPALGKPDGMSTRSTREVKSFPWF
jgi:hypothetical protein